MSAEIADVEPSEAEDDSDWTAGLWGAEEARPDAKKDEDDEWEEAVLNVARVTKVVKGGRQMGFRADVVVGDKKGTVSSQLHLIVSFVNLCRQHTNARKASTG